MSLGLLLHGVVIGFSVSVPVGPIALLCFNRTLRKGWMVGFVTGLGAAFADLVYALVAGLGVRVVSDFLIHHKWQIKVAGGILLIIIGVSIYRSHSYEKEIHDKKGLGLFRNFLTCFVLTLTNPITILAFTAIFAALGIAGDFAKGAGHVASIVVGIFLGSSLWWLFLTAVAAMMHKKMSDTMAHRTHTVTGALIGLAGIVVLISVFWR